MRRRSSAGLGVDDPERAVRFADEAAAVRGKMEAVGEAVIGLGRRVGLRRRAASRGAGPRLPAVAPHDAASRTAGAPSGDHSEGTLHAARKIGDALSLAADREAGGPPARCPRVPSRRGPSVRSPAARPPRRPSGGPTGRTGDRPSRRPAGVDVASGADRQLPRAGSVAAAVGTSRPAFTGAYAGPTRWTVNVTADPSGESRGSVGIRSRYRSSGRGARVEVAANVVPFGSRQRSLERSVASAVMGAQDGDRRLNRHRPESSDYHRAAMTDQLSLRLEPDAAEPAVDPPADARASAARAFRLARPPLRAGLGGPSSAGADPGQPRARRWRRGLHPRSADGLDRARPAGPRGYGVRVAARSAVLDGEIVVVDPSGRVDQDELARRIRGKPGRALAYLAFDLLHVDGRSLLSLPLETARKLAPPRAPPGRRGRGRSAIAEERPRALFAAVSAPRGRRRNSSSPATVTLPARSAKPALALRGRCARRGHGSGDSRNFRRLAVRAAAGSLGEAGDSR